MNNVTKENAKAVKDDTRTGNKKNSVVKGRAAYGLLTEPQVFGQERIAVMQRLGAGCEPSDYAVMRGVCPSSAVSHDWTAPWTLSSAAGYGDVYLADARGERGVAYANAPANLRPVILYWNLQGTETEERTSDPRRVTDNINPDLSGFDRVSYGEYPQTAADRDLAKMLERLYAEGSLRETGKRFDGIHAEIVYEGGKYIRLLWEGKESLHLPSGIVCRPGRAVWICVEPVQWLWDQGAGLLVSMRILTGGIPFCGTNYYDGAFETTGAYAFLNGLFARDLAPSQVREMTQEELERCREDQKRAARRRNPYGLKFGQVSEEDIIRGAIESDVPVFLHGPSSEGKSARVRQIDPSCEIIYLRNATPDSLNGRSVYNQSTGQMIDIPPTWYQKVKTKCEQEPDRFHVVFFDEINNALPSIQGMAFNIVLDREVNGLWQLPDNARIVAAGNDMQDSLAANQIAAPFFNRFAHVYINTTTEKWLGWAREYRIHPAIYSYIAYRQGETLRSRYDGEKPNADPRKWEMASKMLYACGQPEMLRSLIGEEITEEFVQFCSQPVITLEDVLQGNYTQGDIEALNTAGRYATAMGLSQAEEEDMETVRAFASKLGEEYRAVMEEIRERQA